MDDNESNPDEFNFNKEEKVIGGENKKKEDVYEGLKNNEREVQLEIEKHIFESK